MLYKKDEIADTHTDYSLPARLNTRSKAHERGSDILVCYQVKLVSVSHFPQ